MRLRTLVKPAYRHVRSVLGSRFIDDRHHIETSPVVPLASLGLAHPERVTYEPSGWRRLRRALPLEEVGPDDVFLDVGSGMGRVVYQAALQYPFRRVIGVELSEQLNAIAQANLDCNRERLRCPDVVLVCADATRCEVPDDVTVVYMYNPVRGETFAAVLDRLHESLGRRRRRMRLIYRTPEEHDMIMSRGGFRLVRKVRGLGLGREWSRISSTFVYESS